MVLAPDRFAWDIGAGATVLSDGSVRFRLWAPAQEAVSVAIENGRLMPMARDDSGWFEVGTNVAIGTLYRYRLADGLLIPDPASRAQSGDIDGPSVVVAPRSFQWRNTAWRGKPWHQAIIYELHTGLLGGFQGVIDRLPALDELGMTAIELMPINDFPGQRNWGYDGALPFAPDAAYGTPDDLKALIDAAHGRGLMIYLDVVYNHFGPDGNYLAQYAPGFFRTDIKTPWGAAIDFRRPEVRAFFTNNVLMWLMEYRFDGLRFDAVHAISEQDWIDEMAAAVRQSVEPDRQVHLMLEHHNDATHLRQQIDAQWNDDAHNVLHVLLTGESGGYYADYTSQPAVKLARCLKEGWAYQGETSAWLGHPRGMPSGDLPPTSHILFLQNHDQIGNRAFGERLTTLADPAALEAAIALQILCPEIPLIFMGEETANRAPFLYFTDHKPELAEAVRAGRRNEFASFVDFTGNRTLPDPNDIITFQACQPDGDNNARRAYYHNLISIRASHIIPRLAGAKGLASAALGEKSVIATWRMGDGAVLHLLCNLGAEPVSFEPPQGRCLFASGAFKPGELPAFFTLCFLDEPT